MDEIKVEFQVILKPRRKVLAQVPIRHNYTKADYVQALGWVWEDSVFVHDARVGRPIILCEFCTGEKYGWVRPLSQAHFRFDIDRQQWLDKFTGSTVPHLYVL